MAPEVLLKNKYSEKADVYSFGVVLMEIFTGEPPYRHAPYGSMNQAMLMYHITEKEARPCIDGVHPLLQNLIRECWATDPRLRPSFPEIVVRLRRLRAELGNPADGTGMHDSTSPHPASSGSDSTGTVGLETTSSDQSYGDPYIV